MDPRIIFNDSFNVLGVQERHIDPDKEDPGFESIWMKRFVAHHDQIKRLSVDHAYLGLTKKSRLLDSASMCAEQECPLI